MTQEGIARAVWIDIRHVVQYVRPHVADGLILERSAHIRGGRRRRKVYDLTDSGRLIAYGLREKIKGESVQVRDGRGVRDARIAEVLQETRGSLSLVEILRQYEHGGSVDLVHLERPAEGGFVQMLADAPSVEGFLGREKELAELIGEGDLPRLFVIQGVAGIGKSSLAAKVCEHYRDASHVFWHRVRPWDTPQSVLAGLGSFLHALGKPAVKRMVEGGQPDMAPRVFQESLPGIQAVFVLDDAHEASPDLVPFLRFLKDAIRGASDVRLLVLTRQEIPFYDRRDVVLEGMVREMVLERLEPEDVRAFLPALEDDEILAELGRHPLFLRLLLSAPKRAPAVKARRDIHRFIEEAIYVELSDVERNLMKLASLYRVPVSSQALFHDPRSSYDVLMTLVGRSLITPVGGEEFEVHDSIRDFFASVLTPSEEKEFGGYAIASLLSAAARAATEGHLTLRIDFLSNALQLATMGPERLSICEGLGEARERIGDLEGSVESYRMALEVADRSSQRTRLHRKVASVLTLQGEMRQASTELEAGFRARSQTASAESGWLHLAKCRLAVRHEEWEEASEAGRAALNTFQAFDDVLGQGQALRELAHIEVNRPHGQPSEAKQYLEEALALADSLEDPEFTATVHSTLVELLALRLGHTREAKEHLEAMEAYYDPAVDSFGRANFLMLKAIVVLFQEADYGQAEALFAEVRSLAGKLKSKSMAAYASYGLAQNAFYQARFEEARSGFERFALDILELGVFSSAVESMCLAAEACLLVGDPDGFHRFALALQDPKLEEGMEARPHYVKAIAGIDAFLSGSWDESRNQFTDAMSLAKARYPYEALPFLLYGIVLRVKGKETEASEHLETADSILRAYSRRAELAILPERQRLLTESLRQVAPT